MKRIGLALVLVVVFASQAFGAAMDHGNGAIGFHHMEAPLGLRWWFGEEQSMAFDIGVGISSSDAGEERLTDFTIDAGLPIVTKTWERVHFLFRPGVVYESEAFIIAGDTERGSTFSILGELEAEVFVVDNFSISASHGVGIFIDSPPGDNVDSSTNFGTFGNNMTDIGFHLYGLWE